MGTRSNWLGGAVVPDATALTLYTCPEGVRTIVKQMSWGVPSFDGSVPALILSHQVSGGPSLIMFQISPGGFGGYWGSLPTWEVLLPGDSVVIQTDGTIEVTISISGAELLED